MRNNRSGQKFTVFYTEKQKTFIFLKYVEYLSNYLIHPEGTAYQATISFVAVLSNNEEKEEILEQAGIETDTAFAEEPDPFNKFVEIAENCINNGVKRKYISMAMGYFLREKHKSLPKKNKDFLRSKLSELKKIFSLSEEETDILLIAYLGACDDDFENYFSDHNYRDPLKKLMLVSMLTGIKKNRLRRYFSDEAPLRRFGLIDRDIDISYHIQEFLNGFSSNSLSSEFFLPCPAGKLPLKEYEHIADEIEIIKPLILSHSEGESVNILIYGPPGTGKTELCKSLAKELGYKLYQIKQKHSSKGGGTNFRFTALNACLNSVNKAESIILIDEADEMLNGSGGNFLFSRNVEKGIVNDLMESTGAVCIWVTNLALYIDSSTRRRFDYSLEIPDLNSARREKIWNKLVRKYKLGRIVTKKHIRELASEYEMNTGSIDIVLKNFRRISSELPENKANIHTLKSFISAHMKIMTFQERPDSKRKKRENSYCLEALNCISRPGLEDNLKVIKNFYSALYQKEISMPVTNINILLYGPPGTGKSELVRYMADYVDCPLIEKNASDLLDKYVGGTEQNIMQAFKEAENKKGILLIDEADGLIGERKGLKNQWEITQVNEFLKQLEMFRGICICTTNFKENMDAASIRRFTMKMELGYLTPDGIEKLYKTMLAGLVQSKVNSKHIQKIKQLEYLTPGDFKVVLQKFFLYPEDVISHEMLIDALCGEVNAKNQISANKIGF